ncbi:carbohydrate ABC transporter permease [Luteipulveratus halotolerans]|uniref:Sugar ABC transporter permease n=1 Tax=Luteipulveratus halotolerans TaxID=1631356 RepID=A0A0L6CH35_9MICO|nr:carbohydrate ABC transporter permease [Luteipulveratus halotolerans]KNX37029.1 sugar ABC transporter permease [Luteipulveratus halotolerans]
MRVGRGEQVANYVVLAVFAVLAVYPIVTVLVSAFGHDAGAPGGLANFREAWDVGHFGTYLRTSVVVSLIVVSVATVLSLLAGYALGTMRFRGATVLFYVFLLGIMMPAEAVVVPLYFDLRSLGLTDTVWAIVLPQIAQSVAFGTFWLRAYFRTTHRSMVEAARLDGASSWTTLWKVLLPPARPAVTTFVVLSFMWTWNEFLIPLVMVTDDSLRTAPLGLAFFQGQYTQGFTLLAAGAVLVALPVVIVYLFLQRHFIAGMLEGSVRE